MLNPKAKKKGYKIGIWVSRAESRNPESDTEGKSDIIYVGTNKAPCHLSLEGGNIANQSGRTRLALRARTPKRE